MRLCYSFKQIHNRPVFSVPLFRVFALWILLFFSFYPADSLKGQISSRGPAQADALQSDVLAPAFGEGEASFLYNSLDSVQYNNLILHGAGGFYQVPLMGTVRGTWPTEGPIRGHAVGGFGGVCDILTVGNEIARQVGRSSYYSYTWNYVCVR